MKRWRVTAGASTLLLAVSGWAVTTPAAADDVNVAPAKVLSGPLTGIASPRAALTTSAGTWVAQPGSLRLFATGAQGNATPLRTITGAATGLTAVFDVAADAQGRIHVPIVGPHQVRVFSSSASGNVAPLRVLGGPATQLSSPTSVAFDTKGRMYVVNNTSNSITVYAPGAAGDEAPIRVIQGPDTGLVGPARIEIVDRQLWVTNFNNDSVTVHPQSADGNVPPVRTLAGAATGLDQPVGLGLDDVGNVYVGQTGRVSVFSATSKGNVAPRRVLTGGATMIGRAFDVDIAKANRLQVTDFTGRFMTFPAVIPPATAPRRPRALRVQGAARAPKRVVRWKKPNNDGGTAILGYKVQFVRSGRVYLTRTFGPKARKTVVARYKLRPGTNWVRVRAHNKIGKGPWAKARFTAKK